MKKSEMLRACKGFLWDGISKRGEQKYAICYALTEMLGLKQTDELRGIIHKRLKDNTTLFAWLLYECEIPREQLTEAAVQAHRHAWVDLMIKEFEAKGD